MHKLLRIGLGIFIPLMLMGVGQCSQQDSSQGSSSTDEPTSLDTQAFGGYDTEDEEAGFGISSMSQFASDEATDDPTIDDVEDGDLTDSGEYDIYWIRLVWGNLELNVGRGDDDLAVIDWTGSVTLEGDGALILKRLILFDWHDSVIDEDDRKVVAWESYTGPHIDGVLIKVLVPTGTSDGVLSVLAGSFEADISIADLDKYNEITMVDEDGNGMAIIGLKLEDDDCLEGFMQGKYHQHPAHSGGIFRGRFVSEAGIIAGHLRGHYGLNDDGDKVFFGKYIGNSGRFRGRLRGTYDDGAYDGSWVNRAGTTDGTLSGKYVTGAESDSGFFQGLWEETCQ